jgi:Mg-chelatase subunit ChlD
MKRRMTAFLLLSLAGFLSAGTGIISGKVTDGKSGEPLTGVNILLRDTRMGAVTDTGGAFQLTGVPAGTYVLLAQLMGYRKVTVTGLRVAADSTVKLDVRLDQTALEGETVTITADKLDVRKDVTGALKSHDDGASLKSAGESPAEPSLSKTEGVTRSRSSDKPPAATVGAGAGQSSGLKAGVSDDNRQFNYFLQFLQKYRTQVNCYPVPIQERITLKVRDSEGRTLPDADVTVSAAGRILTSGRTYADGSFMFFPSEYDSALTRYRFDIRTRQTEKSLDEERSGKREIETALAVRKSKPDHVPLDILFILDTTGSMGEEIERLKKTIDLIDLNLISLASKPRVRFGLTLFRDKGDDYVTRTVPFTDRIDLFRQALETVHAEGGGDGPEDLQSALRAALSELEWTSEGIRLAFIITDAPPHLDYGQAYTYVDAARDAKRRGIKLFSIGAGGLDLAGETVLRQISQYTSAKYIFLTYGERGESEGGAAGSVSHHTGDNFETGKLEAVVLKFAKEELGSYSDLRPEEGEDYFTAGRTADESREETLKKLFGLAVTQLIDFSTVRVPDATPACLIPLACETGPDRADAEYFTEQLQLALSRDPAFRLVERKNLRQILDELKLGMTGLVDDTSAVRAGRLTGSNLLISGSLVRRPGAFEIFLKLIRIETAEILSVTKLKADLKLGAGG